MVVDASLLDRLREGDSDAWHDVAAAFRQRLRDLAASALPAGVTCRAAASDMVQLSLAEASQSFAAFRGNSLPELFDWLATIVNNNVTDAIRQHVLAQRRTINAELHPDGSSQNGADLDRLCVADHTPP